MDENTIEPPELQRYCKATQARARAALGNKCVGHSRVQNLLFETVTTIKKIQTVAKYTSNNRNT